MTSHVPSETRSAPAAARPSPATALPDAACAPGDLLCRADQCIADALARGVLQPIRTEQTWLESAGLRFSVRWVSSLALKDRARVDTVIRRQPDFNPFLPPEPALTVAPLGRDHLVVLNKFPVIDRHLLIITRDFEDQTSPLSAADFSALATVIAAHDGLGFYNGGRIAGASQAHKHLQWIPTDAADLGPFVPASRLPTPHPINSRGTPDGEAASNPALPWAHAFVALAPEIWQDGARAGASLQAAFQLACRALALPAASAPMPAYNLLVTRDCLLLVPRTHEKWHDVSVNALAYAGSLFVRDREQIERLRQAGPLTVLAAVGRPR